MHKVAEDVRKKDIKAARKKLEQDGFPLSAASAVLAELLQKEGDFQGAIPFYIDAINYGNTYAMNNLAVLYETDLKDFEKAEQYYKMAVEKGNAGAMNNLASLYFELKKNKQEALQLQKRAYEMKQDVKSANGYFTVLLWNDEIEEAVKVYQSAFDSEERQKEVNFYINIALLMLMAKKQYSFVYRLFQENRYDIRDKYKPVYYALLSLMGEKYADELKKIGDEVKESVQDVLKEVDNLEKDFMQG